MGTGNGADAIQDDGAIRNNGACDNFHRTICWLNAQKTETINMKTLDW